MGQILGEVTIRVNGKELKTKTGSTINPGGFTRTQHTGGGKVRGVSKRYTAPSIETVIAADEDVDVIEINAIENATLTWEGNNGVKYMMTGTSVAEPATLREESGDIAVTFFGDKVVGI
ncbi:phage tail protein [Aeromonas sp. ASNIH3]|uniref:phage tail tube protein n=1 Tax=Aeromonas sp. ASNIH3 TaxID=1636608 RepID=UPI000CD30071|nr:phage tail tube protein [Aeromonas sp. ASNIH3]AUV10768.1 phage tail protein [Aeromonas sp. ASNIH3]